MNTSISVFEQNKQTFSGGYIGEGPETARDRRHGDFFDYTSREQIWGYLAVNYCLLPCWLFSSRQSKEGVESSGSPLGHVPSRLVWRSSGGRDVQASGLPEQKFWQLEAFLLSSVVLQCVADITLHKLKRRQNGYQMLIKLWQLTNISYSSVNLN